MVRKSVRDDIREIWKAYKAKGGDDLRNVLVQEYLHLVKYNAERLAVKLPKSVEVDDLTSAGVFGLMNAIDGFDIDREVKFETYCSLRIRGAILDELRAMDWVPRLVRHRAHKIDRTTRELEAELGREPKEKEIAERLGVSVAEYEQMEKEASVASMLSLSEPWSDGGEDSERERRRGDSLEDARVPDPTEHLQREELKGRVIDSLSESEQLVVVLYYYEELTMKEIGAVLDLSESRVCQIHARIINRLRRQLSPLKEDLL